MSDVMLEQNIHVAVNEQRNNIHVINRCLAKLLDNDKKLLELYTTMLGSLQIQPYDIEQTYHENDLVWFANGSDLYVLRCISQNSTYPILDPKTFSFEESGWQNEIEYAHLLKIGADRLLQAQVKDMVLNHSLDQNYHKLGKISYEIASPDYVESKLLNRNLGFQPPYIGKLRSNRKNMHFPYQTFSLQSDASILKGCYRRYDCGLIEYDIIFKFGMSNGREDTTKGEKNVLSANNVVLNSFNTVLDAGASSTYADNSKYFFGQSADIFKIYNDSERNSSTVGPNLQKNRNDIVNTYFAEIKLPQMFYNTNYNVFISDVLSQTSDGKTLNPSPNVMTVCDKAPGSFKVVYVTYPLADQTSFNIEGKNTTSGGLAANSFQCQVVGRWR